MKHSRVSAEGDGLSNDTRKKQTDNIIQRIQLQRIMRHFTFRTLYTNTLLMEKKKTEQNGKYN